MSSTLPLFSWPSFYATPLLVISFWAIKTKVGIRCWDHFLCFGQRSCLWRMSLTSQYQFRLVCYFWSFSYQILVQQVMLNMLYCIVFDSYAFVKTRAGAPLTLYAQIRMPQQQRGRLEALSIFTPWLCNWRTFQTCGKEGDTLCCFGMFVWSWWFNWFQACYPPVSPERKTNDFEKNSINPCQDDDFPAHPNEVVTARSLKRAFERDGMTRANAEAGPPKGP